MLNSGIIVVRLCSRWIVLNRSESSIMKCGLLFVQKRFASEIHWASDCCEVYKSCTIWCAQYSRSLYLMKTISRSVRTISSAIQMFRTAIPWSSDESRVSSNSFFLNNYVCFLCCNTSKVLGLESWAYVLPVFNSPSMRQTLKHRLNSSCDGHADDSLSIDLRNVISLLVITSYRKSM